MTRAPSEMDARHEGQKAGHQLDEEHIKAPTLEQDEECLESKNNLENPGHKKYASYHMPALKLYYCAEEAWYHSSLLECG